MAEAEVPGTLEVPMKPKIEANTGRRSTDPHRSLHNNIAPSENKVLSHVETLPHCIQQPAPPPYSLPQLPQPSSLNTVQPYSITLSATSQFSVNAGQSLGREQSSSSDNITPPYPYDRQEVQYASATPIQPSFFTHPYHFHDPRGDPQSLASLNLPGHPLARVNLPYRLIPEIPYTFNSQSLPLTAPLQPDLRTSGSNPQARSHRRGPFQHLKLPPIQSYNHPGRHPLSSKFDLASVVDPIRQNLEKETAVTGPKENRHNGYRYYEGAEGDSFWIPGKVIQIDYPELTGKGALRSPVEAKKDRYYTTKFGTNIYVTTRPFIVIVVHEKNCLCVPICSYSFQGLASRKLTDKECQDHVVVYSSNKQPDVDNRTNHLPIAIQPRALYGTLHKKSRVNMRKITPVERNVKVLDCGTVNASDFERLQKAVMEIFIESFKR